MSTRAFASWIHVPCAKVIAWGCLRLVRMVGACEGGKPDLNAQLAETFFSAASLGAANLLVHISCADTNGWVVSWQSLAVRLTMLRKYMCRIVSLLLCACFFFHKWQAMAMAQRKHCAIYGDRFSICRLMMPFQTYETVVLSSLELFVHNEHNLQTLDLVPECWQSCKCHWFTLTLQHAFWLHIFISSFHIS